MSLAQPAPPSHPLPSKISSWLNLALKESVAESQVKLHWIGSDDPEDSPNLLPVSSSQPIPVKNTSELHVTYCPLNSSPWPNQATYSIAIVMGQTFHHFSRTNNSPAHYTKPNKGFLLLGPINVLKCFLTNFLVSHGCCPTDHWATPAANWLTFISETRGLGHAVFAFPREAIWISLPSSRKGVNQEQARAALCNVTTQSGVQLIEHNSVTPAQWAALQSWQQEGAWQRSHVHKQHFNQSQVSTSHKSLGFGWNLGSSSRYTQTHLSGYNAAVILHTNTHTPWRKVTSVNSNFNKTSFSCINLCPQHSDSTTLAFAGHGKMGHKLDVKCASTTAVTDQKGDFEDENALNKTGLKWIIAKLNLIFLKFFFNRVKRQQ